MWESLQYVTSGFSLVGFVVAAISWVYKSKSEERERLILTAKENKRADLVRLALEIFDIDTSTLTKEQKYELALEQIHARAKRFRTIAIVICILAFLPFAVSIYAITISPSLIPTPGAPAILHNEKPNGGKWIEPIKQ